VAQHIAPQPAVHGYGRLRRDALRHAPDLVVVCFGLNDVFSPDIKPYTDALECIFTDIIASGAECLFLTPNMMCTRVDWRLPEIARSVAERAAELQNSGAMDRLMDAAREAAIHCNITVCDAYARWKGLHLSGVDITGLLSNYINHPNADMHVFLAGMLFEMLCIV
jgi:lysophospholipase L1-like esterase